MTVATPSSRTDLYAAFKDATYFPSLNGIRAVCALMVVKIHVHWSFAGSASTSMLDRGFLGVDMFFIISGFLIVTLLLRERVHSARVDRLPIRADRQHRVHVDDRYQQLLDIEFCADVTVGGPSKRTQCMDTGRHRRRGRMHHSTLRLESGENVVITHAQDIAIGKPVAARTALGKRLRVIVDVHPVGAHVLQVEVSLAELHPRVVRGHVALRVGQHPVVVGRAPDRAALDREGRATALTERAPLFADDPQPEHGSPTQMSDPCATAGSAFPRGATTSRAVAPGHIMPASKLAATPV